MSWFDTAGIASFAKSALTTAQKTIDKALDIQEEKTSKLEKQPIKKADADSFFEAFGISDKPSTSQPPPTRPENQNVNHPGHVAQQQSGLSVQGSGYWTDTWGSFFEIKSQNTTQPDTKNNEAVKDDTPNDNKFRKDDAVLSQPHRASLFPGDPPQTQILTHSPDQKEDFTKHSHTQYLDLHETNVLETEDPTDSLNKVRNEETIGVESGEGNETSVVTEQPSSELGLGSKDPLICSSSSNSNTPSDTNETLQVNIPICDNKSSGAINAASSSNVSINDPNVPVNKLAPGLSVSKPMEQSEFLQLDLSAPLGKQSEKPESEHIVQDLTEKEILNSTMVISTGSFTHLASAEDSPIAESSSYDISSSTLVIPDLPVSVSQNVVNWECCALDDVSSDLYTADETDNSNFLVQKRELSRSQNVNVTSSDSPFHTISVDSFNNNLAWSKTNKPSHLIDESQHSSNGERNSHHSDGSSNSSKDDDDTDTAEIKEYDTKSTSSSGSHTTSSSSFVKCSPEETDNNSHRGHSPVSTTASERSDITKQESEQTYSGDENETATSSDIEVLSPPNGENGDRNVSPLKHVWMSRPLRFRRSESPTSDSSKESMMPVVSELEEVSYEDESHSTTLYDDKEDPDCSKHYGEDDNIGMLLQKQDELQTILDAREKKIVELSKENIELQENEQRLKNLMQKMRIEQAKESRDITALTREFTQRLSHVEGQLKEADKDRNLLRQQLEEAKLEVDKRILAADFEDVIKEKDQQIEELTEEGQKLAKKELTHTTIIKKLRVKEDDMNKTIKSQSEKLEDTLKEVERLRKSIGAKEEQEKKHIDVIRNLNNSVKQLEKEVSSLKSDLEDNLEKQHSFKKSLDTTYKEYTELQKSHAIKVTEVEELKSSLELKAKEDFQLKLENANKESAREKDMLVTEMQQLRYTVSQSQEEANLREKMFKDEIANLQRRLQEAEERNEDLTKNMSSATRPLVRQIENLQATFTTQTISWEKIEKNLTDRLSDAQNKVALISEKERAATERYLEYQSKLTALESQNNSLRQEKLQLSAEIESLRTKIIMLEENKSRETYTLDKVKQNFNSEITKLKQDKVGLEATMSTCLEQLDFEKRKVKKLEEEIKIKDARALIMSDLSPCPSPTGSVRSSISSLHNWSQDESHDHGTSTPVNSYRMSVYDSLRLGSGSSLLENLQSQLKQREGEILQLQSEIAKLEQVKESMTRELVLLSEQNEELDTKVNNLETVEKDFKDLDQKYNTLLQMYGEKVEETEELQLDLSDVKSMYKAQIEELLMKK